MSVEGYGSFMGASEELDKPNSEAYTMLQQGHPVMGIGSIEDSFLATLHEYRKVDVDKLVKRLNKILGSSSARLRTLYKLFQRIYMELALTPLARLRSVVYRAARLAEKHAVNGLPAIAPILHRAIVPSLGAIWGLGLSHIAYRASRSGWALDVDSGQLIQTPQTNMRLLEHRDEYARRLVSYSGGSISWPVARRIASEIFYRFPPSIAL